jgi:hypothetical protein
VKAKRKQIIETDASYSLFFSILWRRHAKQSSLNIIPMKFYNGLKKGEVLATSSLT